MAGVARNVVPGMAHRVTQNGNRRMETFFREDDYRAYLALLVEWWRRGGVRLLAYCPMPNHVHLIAIPETAEGLCRGIGEAHRRYTRRVNFREGWRGHLWQGRFASHVMDEPYLLADTLARMPWFAASAPARPGFQMATRAIGLRDSPCRRQGGLVE